MKKQALHPKARTTPAIRKEIQESQESISALARKYNISRITVRKWKNRESIEDASHAPQHHGQQKLSDSDIQFIVKTRESTSLVLDDLLEVLKPQLTVSISRAQLSKILNKHGLTRKKQPPLRRKGQFADYEPGYLHIDCTYLPKINGVQKKAVCAIDRKTKWAFVEIHERLTKETGKQFLERLVAVCPLKIHTVLTDNGVEFTFCGTPSKNPHPFRAACEQFGIKHKLTKVCHPWTNGQVERFNGQLKSATFKQCRYNSNEELEAAIMRWVLWYNEECRLRSLRRLSSNEAVALFLKNKIGNTTINTC